MILIDTTFVNSLGGINILNQIIESIPNKSRKKFIILIDKRLKNRIEIISSFEHYFTSNLINRQIKFEKIKKKIKVIFCLGNVPLLFTGNRYQITYNMQYFLFYQKQLGLKKSIIWKIKSLIIRLFFKISDSNVAAQTDSIKKLFIKKFNISEEKIFLFPIFKVIDFNTNETNKNLLFCPSSGEKYKKIKFLINAFKIHNKSFPKTKLILTIDSKYSSLIDLIKHVNKKNEIIINKGSISHSEIIDLMKKGSIIIHPSVIESFGLVLLEASQLKSIIIAPKLSYVNDVCIPSYTYNPKKLYELVECLKKTQKNELKKSQPVLTSATKHLVKHLLTK